MRYFKEQMPELHVMGASSLLEFTLNDADCRMPVGRVQSMYLKPLSVQEFLIAHGFSKLLDITKNADANNPIPGAIHQQLLEVLHEHFIIGGMPAVVANYLEQRDLTQSQIIQNLLLNTYRNDFGKYTSTAKHKYLQAIFDKALGMIGAHFRYIKIDPDMQSRDLRSAINALKDARLIYTIHSIQDSGLPLNALANEKKFKLLFLDVSLVKVASQLDFILLTNKDLMLINQGMLVKQFVGQELLTNISANLPGQLFYWAREAKSSSVEIDYVVNIDEKIDPIEVKSGKTSRIIFYPFRSLYDL